MDLLDFREIKPMDKEQEIQKLKQELEEINNQIDELKNKELEDFRNTVSFIKTGKKLN